MADVKFAVKNGSREISYEGTEEFLKEELRPILEYLFESSIWNNGVTVSPTDDEIPDEVENNGNRSIPQMTMNTVCARLSCDSGPELALAACAYLLIVAGNDTAPRRQILQTMKEANKYYKDTYASNLSKILQSLVSQKKLMERSDEVYVLTPVCWNELEAKLAES